MMFDCISPHIYICDISFLRLYNPVYDLQIVRNLGMRVCHSRTEKMCSSYKIYKATFPRTALEISTSPISKDTRIMLCIQKLLQDPDLSQTKLMLQSLALNLCVNISGLLFRLFTWLTLFISVMSTCSTVLFFSTVCLE